MKQVTAMGAPLGHMRLIPEVWKETFAHLPMRWRTMCCRVCKVWQMDFEDHKLVDYGLATLCSALANRKEDKDEVMLRILLHYPSSGIPADLGRTDQVRRFLQRHRRKWSDSVDEWMQLALQEPDAGWLCQGAFKTKLEGTGNCLMRQVVGKPQDFCKILQTLEHSVDVSIIEDCFVGYSPDGSTIAIADPEIYGAVRLVYTKTMVVKGTLKGHACAVTCVAYSPDGKHIASGSHDRTVRVWDAETMKDVGCLKWHTDSVYSVAWSPDGETIASGSGDETVRLCTKWAQRGRVLRGRSGIGVGSVAWSLDGTVIAYGYCNTVHMWRKLGERPWEPVGTLEGDSDGHSGWVLCVAYSPDGKHITSGSNDKTVKIWDAETTQEVCSLKGHSENNPECTCKHHQQYEANPECPVRGHSCDVLCVAYSPDGKRIASGSHDSTVRIWDAETKQEVCCLRGHFMGVYSVAFAPDVNTVASASGDFSVKVWDLTGESAVEEDWVRRGGVSVLSVASSPDSKSLASASGDCTVKLWDLSGETPVEKGTLAGRHSEEVISVAYSPDSKSLASALEDGTVQLWDLSGETPVEKGTLNGGPGAVSSSGEAPEAWCVAYSPDGKRIASGHSGEVVIFWDAATMMQVGTLTGHSGGVPCVAYSPDGKRIASADGDGGVKIWDTKTRREVFEMDEDCIMSCVVWSPDGEFIATTQEHGELRVRSKEGELLGDGLWGHVASWQCQYRDPEYAGSSRKSQYMVTAMDEMVYVYRMDLDGERPLQPDEHTPMACFSSRTRVASVCCTGTSVFAGCGDGQVSCHLPCGANVAVF